MRAYSGAKNVDVDLYSRTAVPTQLFRVSDLAAIADSARLIDAFTASKCQVTCSGVSTENCGGSMTMNLYRNPSNTVGSVPASIPAGWKSLGCMADNVNGKRTLSGYTFASSDMTLQKCVSTCQSKGFSYAGSEYETECFCGNEPTILQASTKCSMGCGGDPRYMCGGGNALSMVGHVRSYPVLCKRR